MTTAADVSASELAVLDTILASRIAFIPDVAIVTKLTPSETKEIVTSLTEKQLVEEVDPYVVRITDRGKLVAKRGRYRDPHTHFSDVDPQELEAAFQDALKKLSG
jgi:Fe-S-cluster formation regulator IscX/YfhJ